MAPSVSCKDLRQWHRQRCWILRLPQGDQLKADCGDRGLGEEKAWPRALPIPFHKGEDEPTVPWAVFLTTCILAVKEKHKIFIFKIGWMRTTEISHLVKDLTFMSRTHILKKKTKSELVACIYNPSTEEAVSKSLGLTGHLA